MNHQSSHADILILGAGMAGLGAFYQLKKLLRRHGLKKTITIVDQHNYFVLTPLLHEVAFGAVQPNQATIPIREIIHGTPHHFVRATVTSVQPATKTVETSVGSITFDYCIMALGSAVNHYGTPGADENTFNVRTLAESLRLHKQLVKTLESSTPEMNIVIVGGGATGVETAGQAAELRKKEIRALYPEKRTTITVVQQGPALLSAADPTLQRWAEAKLKKLDVRVLLNTTVKEVTANEIILGNGDRLASSLTIWTAGVKNTGDCFLSQEYCERGRITVTNSLQLPSHQHVYVAGDMSGAIDPKTKKPYAQYAQTAQSQGEYIARHIIASLKNQTMPPFRYRSLGTLLPIGNWYAIGRIGKLPISGWFAWWLRRTIYLMIHPGIDHKLRIAADWTFHSWDFSHHIDTE